MIQSKLAQMEFVAPLFTTWWGIPVCVVFLILLFFIAKRDKK